jgi:hypothetical protein
MAFLPIEQQNQQAPTGTTSAGSPPPQTGGSSGAGGAPQKTGTATGTPTQFGSSASKLGDYLSANAPQIQNQANQVVSGLNQQYGQVGQDINNAATQFGQSVSQGYAAPNQDVVNQATSNPTGFASDPNNVKAFQAQYNDTYTGPQNFESTTPYAGIQNEVSQAVQNAGLLNTTPGLQSYFQGKGGPNATQASNTLDALLLQGNPGAQQSIQNAAGQFGNLTNQFGQAIQTGDQSVQAAQQAAQQAQQYAQGQFGNAVTGFNTNLQNELAAANTGNTAYNTQIDALRSQLQSGQLPTQYGVDPGLQAFLTQYMNPSVAPLGGAAYNYVNALPSNINPQVPQLGQVASAQDYATLAALNQLGGTPINSPLSADTANQAGTYKAPTIANLNNQTLAGDILSGAQGVNGQMNAQQYNQYLSDIQALNNYLNNGQNAFGNQPGMNTNPYGLVPTIA